jgi:hypothetical protein
MAGLAGAPSLLKPGFRPRSRKRQPISSRSWRSSAVSYCSGIRKLRWRRSAAGAVRKTAILWNHRHPFRDARLRKALWISIPTAVRFNRWLRAYYDQRGRPAKWHSSRRYESISRLALLTILYAT